MLNFENMSQQYAPTKISHQWTYGNSCSQLKLFGWMLLMREIPKHNIKLRSANLTKSWRFSTCFNCFAIPRHFTFTINPVSSLLKESAKGLPFEFAVQRHPTSGLAWIRWDSLVSSEWIQNPTESA